ncbi:MAG: sigma-70 family RNA polymerase sigma factor [Candidatus Thiodiazotropha taylori]|uniref:Sigma-70 family RNA polymerase sigma factor n=1 Tax=Candidatus Thiodiazotropha taylori TaxID=2792791 RepID=A0A9E4KAN5_9GAMM|nr:sigma-70 family RNA polymerase sigma factor [Candidatus Thiodiazotropha taylori]MCW4254928.1 sigma-70 family RNA polymerase sigma factor [Candidatus Thiodiazotropha taylori]
MAKRKQPETIEEAVEMMKRYVGRIASKWARNHRTDYDDLYSEGMMGVCVAWGKFDPTKGTHFTTYAYLWASAYIRIAAKKNWNDYNNTVSGDVIHNKIETIGDAESSVNFISVKNELSKLSMIDQQIFIMRTEGYTFDEISKKVGFGSLHKARNRFLEINEMVTS